MKYDDIDSHWNRYTQLALSTESEHDPVTGLPFSPHERQLHAEIGLATESGELLDNRKRKMFYGLEDSENIAEEIGDLLWYMALLLDSHRLKLSDVMKANIEKLSSRYGKGKFDAIDAQHRNIEAERDAMRATNVPQTQPETD